ncbi:hypothetical protein GN958_ATG06273 [Phytophthora infestans]|uniref:Uncharacterized protein n=1 Tax=Phytophthora infestans TaxID=4787 RepID=A0A8S9V281_PHYIN|nr:hypothetical protein GN958_ATG06273 [Phytophthora infestans]
MLKKLSNTATVMGQSTVYSTACSTESTTVSSTETSTETSSASSQDYSFISRQPHDFVKLLYRQFDSFSPIIIDELSKFCVKPVPVYIGYADIAVGSIATYCAVIIVKCFVIQ